MKKNHEKTKKKLWKEKKMKKNCEKPMREMSLW